MNMDLYRLNDWGRRIHILDVPNLFVRITSNEQLQEHAAKYSQARYCIERDTGMWLSFSGLIDGMKVIAATVDDVKIDGWGWVLKGTSLFVEV